MEGCVLNWVILKWWWCSKFAQILWWQIWLNFFHLFIYLFTMLSRTLLLSGIIKIRTIDFESRIWLYWCRSTIIHFDFFVSRLNLSCLILVFITTCTYPTFLSVDIKIFFYIILQILSFLLYLLCCRNFWILNWILINLNLSCHFFVNL